MENPINTISKLATFIQRTRTQMSREFGSSRGKLLQNSAKILHCPRLVSAPVLFSPVFNKPLVMAVGRNGTGLRMLKGLGRTDQQLGKTNSPLNGNWHSQEQKRGSVIRDRSLITGLGRGFKTGG